MGEEIKRKARRILGVDQEAGIEEIQQVYRKLVKKYHPDHNPDDQECVEKFKLVVEAYEVLCGVKHTGRYSILNTDISEEKNVSDKEYWEWWRKQYGHLF